LSRNGSGREASQATVASILEIDGDVELPYLRQRW